MYNNRGITENKEEKKREVLYRIAMNNPRAEILSCDFIEVAKLRPGLVAIQVCPDSDPVWGEKPSRKGSENCRGLCKSKHSSKQGHGTTAVLSIAKRKIISRGRLRCHRTGPELEFKPIMYPDETPTRNDAIDNEQKEEEEDHLSSSSLCLKELQQSESKSTPGWPLLRQAFPVSQEVLSKSEERELSVVQWVMNLPNRSSPVIMQIQNEEKDNSMVHDEWEIERTSKQSVQISEDKPMDGCENTENEDFGLQQSVLGWPLLQKTASATPEASAELKLAQEMTVIQWAMSLPDRNITPVEKETNDSEVDNTCNMNSPAESANLPNDLDLLKINSSGCRWFSYEELNSATSQFSSENLIGEGGCSSVYKGRLPSDQPVAVKISKSYKEAWNNFSQEINITTLLNHKYIAPLIGICLQDSHLISVYNFLPRGSLEENLHGENENQVLPWEVRFKVAVVVAEALNYLHEECSPPVIHRDIKSSNILLSDDFQPQISDFGLAILGPTDSTEMLDSDVVGTFGYIAPEYFMNGRVSDKIDIYSFGVVLLELLSGRRPIGSRTLTEEASLVKWAKPILESGDVKALVDPKLEGNFESVQMHRVAVAAASCINESAELRPKGSQILKLLRGEKDGEEWFYELKERRKREEVGFDVRNVDFITSHNSCVIKEERKRFTLGEFLRG